MGVMGHKVRNVFAAVAATLAMNASAQPAPDKPFFIPGPPQPQGVTQEDLRQLDAYFNAASASFGQRAVEKCAPERDGKAEGQFKNTDVAGITSLDQLVPGLPPNNAVRFKLLATMADKLGWTVCMDDRMPALGVNFSINLQSRVIGLSPVPFNGPSPAAAMQMNFSAALSSVAANTKMFTAEPEGVVAGLSVPFSGGRNPEPRLQMKDKEVISRLQPAPIKGAVMPYEVQKALGIWQVKYTY
jgi:hypothetical protein